MGKPNAKIEQLPDLLLPWYRENKRDLPWRKSRDPYAVWISEIMLQQTRVEAAKEFYVRFLKELPTVFALASVSEERLMKLWEGLGYYTRARNLKKAATIVAEEFGGAFPSSFEGLRSLPGIGDYTAGAIASIAFELPCAAVDGNVLRVLARFLGDHACVDDLKVRAAYATALEKVYPNGECGDFTQSLMELGAIVCVPNGAPFCESCPLAETCVARAKGEIDELPVRAPKRPRKKVEMTVFILEREGKTALCKREEKGVLNGLWQLPNCLGVLSEEEAFSHLQKEGVLPVCILETKHERHVFTHLEWEMTCYRVSCGGRGTYTWVSLADDEGHSVPSAFKKCLWEKDQ